MKVTELFGPTLQGEGPHAGKLVSFLRLAGCNLSCPWCDTKYAQGEMGAIEMRPEGVAASLVAMDAEVAVITGGEPLLQVEEIIDVACRINGELDLHLETNGTIAPTEELLECFEHVSVSPKREALATDAGLDALRAWAEHDWPAFKFVVADEDDVAEVAEVVYELSIAPRQVWLMPLGATRKDQVLRLPVIAELAVQYRFNLSPRLHVLAWDDKKGV